MGRKWRVAPYVSASIGTLFDKVKFNGATVTDDANVSLLQIGIGVRR
jgi:hypothetical protein